MGTRLGDMHRKTPSDTGKPHHAADPVAMAASHQPRSTEATRKALGKQSAEDMYWRNNSATTTEHEYGETGSAAPSQKFDHGKPPLTIIDPAFLLDMASVLKFGEDKYGHLNWQGLSVERLLDAHQRHTLAFLAGEELDPETGKPHLIHASSCLMMVNWIMKNRRKQDDRRYKKSQS